MRFIATITACLVMLAPSMLVSAQASQSGSWTVIRAPNVGVYGFIGASLALSSKILLNGDAGTTACTDLAKTAPSDVQLATHKFSPAATVATSTSVNINVTSLKPGTYNPCILLDGAAKFAKMTKTSGDIAVTIVAVAYYKSMNPTSFGKYQKSFSTVIEGLVAGWTMWGSTIPTTGANGGVVGASGCYTTSAPSASSSTKIKKATVTANNAVLEPKVAQATTTFIYCVQKESSAVGMTIFVGPTGGEAVVVKGNVMDAPVVETFTPLTYTKAEVAFTFAIALKTTSFWAFNLPKDPFAATGNCFTDAPAAASETGVFTKAVKAATDDATGLTLDMKLMSKDVIICRAVKDAKGLTLTSGTKTDAKLIVVKAPAPPKSSSGSSGLSGGIIALIVILPLVFVAAVCGFVFWFKRRSD